jgi:uncharacterized membrane protein (DUF2068 family)
LIAAERTLRAIVLFMVGIALIANPHHNWGKTVAHFARDLGLNPHSNGIERIIHRLHAISSHRYAVFGTIALAYGVLEAVEGYGLWRCRRWAEYLTILATSLLFIPEIWELARKATLLNSAPATVQADTPRPSRRSTATPRARQRPRCRVELDATVDRALSSARASVGS